MRSPITLLFGCLFALAISTGCKPTYPKCDNDDHCKEGEFCVNKTCQQCRNDKDCGEGKKCNEGRCDAIAGWCKSNSDCPDGQACKNNKCGPCSGDADCEGGKCNQGKCLKPGACTTDDDCPENHECQNGRCVAPPTDTTQGAKCSLETVYFDFNDFVLSGDATAKLQKVADCIKKEGRKVRVEGHCDPRGTEEYNLALGDRRARSVNKYLKRLGVKKSLLRAVSKGKLEATGSNAATWARDRKVQFIWE